MASWLEKNLPWLQRSGERWGCLKVEPLHLRVWLSSPVAFDAYDGLALDGALQHAVVSVEAGVPSDVFVGVPTDVTVSIPIPIADVEIGGRPIAMASRGVFPATAVESSRWLRHRTRVEQIGLDTVRVNGGPHKSTQIQKSTMIAPWVDFFVRGDADRLVALLQDIGTIGAARSGGLGTILRVDIAVDQQDRSVIFDGVPQRTLPLVEDGGPWSIEHFDPSSYEIREATTRAPYWHRQSRTTCVVPIHRPRLEAA